MDNEQQTVEMELTLENYGFGMKNTNVNILKKNTVIRSNKCNQCDFASSRAGNLRIHLITHSGEKLNKCNQCEFPSSEAGHLRIHLETHSGEKSYKCNQCDFASNLRRHLKTHSGEKSNKCN